jgi:hypothetical protein
MQTKLLIIHANYDAIHELLIIYSALNKYPQKRERERDRDRGGEYK